MTCIDEDLLEMTEELTHEPLSGKEKDFDVVFKVITIGDPGKLSKIACKTGFLTQLSLGRQWKVESS
jgi:citrate lyase alpha subunit